jgi:hypothetical protein
MDWRGMAGSAFVNGTATLLALTAPPYRLAVSAPDDRESAQPLLRLTPPRIVLIGSRRHVEPDADAPWGSALSAGTQCPLSEIGRDAAPAFPVSGAGAPLDWLGPMPANPVYCVRIQARGRIDAILLAATSGDPLADRAIPGTLRGLRFVPAERDGVPVTAWHRLLINQPY